MADATTEPQKQDPIAGVSLRPIQETSKLMMNTPEDVVFLTRSEARELAFRILNQADRLPL